MNNITTKVLGLDGTEKEELVLDERIFGVKFDPHLVKLAFDRQLSNERNAIAHTKTRGEVAGSKTKIYKQKGTGRARQGQKQAPHRAGGGVAFGPRSERNFEKELPKKMRKKAIFSALSQSLSDGDLRIVENIAFEEAKTKVAFDVIAKISGSKKNLIISPDESGTLGLSFRNIPKQKLLKPHCLNMKDLVSFDKIFITIDGLNNIYKTYIPESDLAEDTKDNASEKQSSSRIVKKPVAKKTSMKKNEGGEK